MHKNPRSRRFNCLLSFSVGLSAMLVFSPMARAQPLVDCSKPEFKSINSARSMFLWTDGAEEEIHKAKAQGVHEARGHAAHGPGTMVGYCKKIIGLRGAAHCKEPENPQYRQGLISILKACKEASTPPKTDVAGAPVDCKEKRFHRPGVSVDQLLRWVEMGLRDVNRLAKHEQFRLKPKCEMALDSAGAAYCKAPDNPKTKAAVADVRQRCGAAAGKIAADKEAEAAAEKARASKAKADRKIVKFPPSSYSGRGGAALAAEMKRALVKSRMAKAAREVLRVRPMGSWQAGRYRGTKVPYKKIMGTVLWYDEDKDGVCRYVSYKFVKEQKRGKWSPLRFNAFCLSCPEGWTRCK